MTELNLKITIGNDTMQTTLDVVNALAGVAKQIMQGTKAAVIRDVNGNTVGSWLINE